MKTLRSWLLAVSAISGLSHGAQICNLSFDQCPGNFTSGTITVPQNVIWIDQALPVCTENVQVQTGNTSPPPTIVFIIDNSGSMDQTDPDEARFSTTLTLLDSIYKVQPATKVGVVVFCRRLVFDHRDNPFFKTAFPNDPTQHDSYIPITALNQTFPNGRTGLDTLKSLLDYKSNGALTYQTVQPAQRTNADGPTQNAPTDTRKGTDITLGFEAAKLAMSADNNAKDNQYFIFLSDGTPSSVDDGRQSVMWDWVKGAGDPTTFTVFFGNDRKSIDSLGKMNTNIQNNGYSTGQARSRQWAINLPAQELLSLLQTSVINPIFANTPGKPQSAVMTVGGTSYNSTGVSGNKFTFPGRVPLSADQTTVTLNYTYSYTDSGKTKTKVVPYTLNIKRSGTGSLATGLSSSCQEQGNIALYSNNTAINLVTADHTTLDVRLTLANGEVCNGCTVEVKPNKSTDKENVTLKPAGGYEGGTFGRETSAQPKPQDGVLQNVPTDSIIITYVNPSNPLDVIRKAFPYSDVSTALQVQQHNDWSRGVAVNDAKPGEHFVLVAPVNLDPKAEGTAKNWGIVPALVTEADSLRYVGSIIEASRAFKVEVQIFTNLGQFVNRIEFSLSQAEFNKLAKGVKNNTRRLKVLWDNRAADGSLAGTGAYILKTTVTLLKIPGVAEDESVSTDFRIVGVLHPAR
jgi:hypothetical protein